MQGGGKKEGTIMVARDTNFGSLANMVFFFVQLGCFCTVATETLALGRGRMQFFACVSDSQRV